MSLTSAIGVGRAASGRSLFTLWSSIDEPRNAEINTRLSAFHKSCLDNDLRMGRADAYVFSFPMEAQWSYYAFKTTGLEVPLRLSGREIKNFGDLTKLSSRNCGCRPPLKFQQRTGNGFAPISNMWRKLGRAICPQSARPSSVHREQAKSFLTAEHKARTPWALA